ncbi:MAG: ABC transporter ATP-binding protein [Deltaproteobacteria bacterium]|nr:ABC transporter ATP-binding protein [Deltaproteobacteria bacterium]
MYGLPSPNNPRDAKFIPDDPKKGLEIKNVSKTYDNAGNVVLNEINLDVAPNTFFALLGPSGCGKSTLLKIIAGLEKHSAGEISLNGTDITNLSARDRPINLVFQNFALFPHYRVYENITFGLEAQGIPETEYSDDVEKVIKDLNLTELKEKFPDQLSGGQQQRVALARALVNKPKVILLDEPLSHLDDYLKAKVCQDLRDLQKRLENIFIIVTHDREDAMAISDEMAILHEGKIVQQGKPKDIFCRPKTTFVANFMGKSNTFAFKRDENCAKRAILPFVKLEFDEDLPEDVSHFLINPESVEIIPKSESNPPGATDPINPESVEIIPESKSNPPGATDPSVVEAKILKTNYRGYDMEILFEIANVHGEEYYADSQAPGEGSATRLLVRTDAEVDLDLAEGKEIFLGFSPKKIVMLSRTTANPESTPVGREDNAGDLVEKRNRDSAPVPQAQSTLSASPLSATSTAA